MYVIEREFRVHEDDAKKLLWAVTKYGSRARKAPGVLGCDLLHHADDGTAYVLHETFRDEAAQREHDRKKYAEQFRHALATLALEPIVTRRLRSAVGAHAATPPRPHKAAWETVANARGNKKLGGNEPFVWLRAKMTRIEFATATDGPMRGRPDPAILLALFHVEDGKSGLIGRLLWRVKMSSEAPFVARPTEALLEVPCSMDQLPARVVVLAVGIEENAGRGVTEAYQQLEDAEQTMLSRLSHAEAATESVAEFAGGEGPHARGEAVLPIVDGSPLPDRMDDDTWVGASASVVELSPANLEDVLQFRLCTDPKVNDWRATVCFSVGTGMG